MQATHIRPLTGIRFFAAAWVVALHFHPWLVRLCPALRHGDFIVKNGYEAVPFFFILSGFILSYSYCSEFSLVRHPKFIFLRFARLWPVHLVTLLLLITGPGLFKMDGGTAGSLVEEVLMVRSWYHSNPAWNAPAWSISAEWFAYICVFPLACLWFRGIRSIPWLTAMVTCLLAAQVLPINGILFPGDNRCGAIFFLFLAGCGLYQIRRVTSKAPAEMLVSAGLLLFALYMVFSQSLSELVLYIAFALLIFGLSYERGFLARFLSMKPIVYGGLISYSLYMTHYVVIQTYIYYSWTTWNKLPSSPILSFDILLIMAAVFIGTAALFYRCIEEPANRRLRRLLRSKNIKTPAGEGLMVNLSV